MQSIRRRMALSSAAVCSCLSDGLSIGKSSPENSSVVTGRGIQSIQLDRLFPVLIKLLEPDLGFLEGARCLLDPLAVAVQIRRGHPLFQLAQARFLGRDVGFQI